MRIARCSSEGRSFWAVVDLARRVVTPIRGSFASWAPQVTLSRSKEVLELGSDEVALDKVQLLPPVEKTSKIEVVGANYARHLAELRLEGSSQPVVFLKAYGALIGGCDPIRYPPKTNKLDYEVELVVVVGAAPLDHVDPLSCVLGYTVGNDVSARDLQMLGPRDISMDLFGAKSQDRTCGVGPWIVTADEFPEGQPNLKMEIRVNGATRQSGESGDMTWTVAELLRFADERSSLEPGDILFTGTPQGVGHASGRFLKRGDVVEAEIEGIGTLRNCVE
jgi:2-keto-4-pentenoate hydratase/2-oxohepta-3-ene-1,7-dioic acid hydratase in catechol pathway